MRRRFIALEPADTLLEAERLMRMARLRAVPVTDGEALVGVLSYRALLVWCLGEAAGDRRAHEQRLAEALVASLMDEWPATVPPETDLADAVARLIERTEGCIPVVNRSARLLGIVTELDLLRAAYDPHPRPS